MQASLEPRTILDRIKPSSLFGYVHCGIKTCEQLREKIANFAPIFKKTNLCRQDAGPQMQGYDEKEDLLSQLRRTLNSSFKQTIRTVIRTVLLFLLFKLERGLLCTKVYCFVEYNPVKAFNDFMQSAVNAGCHGDNNPDSSVFAECMRLLANRSYGSRNMDFNRHSVARYTNDQETYAALNN